MDRAEGMDGTREGGTGGGGKWEGWIDETVC